jgi:hypothetical protein
MAPGARACAVYHLPPGWRPTVLTGCVDRLGGEEGMRTGARVFSCLAVRCADCMQPLRRSRCATCRCFEVPRNPKGVRPKCTCSTRGVHVASGTSGTIQIQRRWPTQAASRCRRRTASPGSSLPGPCTRQTLGSWAKIVRIPGNRQVRGTIQSRSRSR